MVISEQAFAQALLLAGPLEPERQDKLQTLCQGVESSLKRRIREGLSPEDFRADYIAAVGRYGVAALSELESLSAPGSFSAADLTVQRTDTSASVNCLRLQAEMLMAPYCKDSFCFRGI